MTDKPNWQRRIERAQRLDRIIDRITSAIVALSAAIAVAFIIWLATL